MNNCHVDGNCTSEIKFITTEGGKEIAQFDLAVNKKFTKKDGTTQEEVSFFTVKAFGYMAGIAHTFGKGDFISVSGELKQERWQNEAGEMRSKVVIIAFSLAKISNSKKNQPESDKEPENESVPF